MNTRREVEIKLCDPAGLAWGNSRWHLWKRKPWWALEPV